MSKQTTRSTAGAGMSYRRTQREERRAARLRAEARARRDQRIRQVALIAGSALTVALVIFLIVRAASGGGTSTAKIAGVATFDNLARGHQTGTISYPQTPPVGGPHNPVWENCGVYTAPITNENGVHTLEHGAVWITYRPDLPVAAVQQLRDLVQGRSYVLLSPYPDLPAPVVASAWGVQLKVQDVSDARLSKFVETYEQGPQTPEPGATCSGGTSSTVSQGK